jgi:hypothetical protein
MNSETGHLVSDMALAKSGLYVPVPKELEPSARRALAGRAEAYVPRRSRSKLARWAAKKRKEQKASRKRNR